MLEVLLLMLYVKDWFEVGARSHSRLAEAHSSTFGWRKSQPIRNSLCSAHIRSNWVSLTLLSPLQDMDLRPR